MTVFAVIAMAMLPLLLTGLKATVQTKLETEAKNLAQLRIERMRALAFHVDEQNGPFVDLLDLYYTNTCTPAVARTDGSTGAWLADADAATPGAPNGPAYVVTFPSVDGLVDFRQRVYTQFLRTTHTVAGVPAGCTTTSYDSQAAGRDEPPSQLVSVTVLTSWNRSGNSGTLRTYTEVADDRGNLPLITTQAQALALRVSATTSEATPQTLLAQAGQVKADGSLTTGSVAGMQAEAARAEIVGQAGILGATAGISAPGTGTPANPVGNTGTSATANEDEVGDSGCGWSSFGKSRVENASATTDSGLPLVPSDAVTDAAAPTAPRTRSGLVTSGNGCGGKSFAWRNYVEAPSYPAPYGVRNDIPLVHIDDVSGGGDLTGSPIAAGATVSATNLIASPRHVSSKATARTGIVRVMPTNNRSTGLVTVQLSQSEIVCKSGVAVSASYEVRLRWPGVTTDQVFTMNNAASLPAPSSITFVEGSVTRNLGEYLTWGLATAVKEGTNGVRSVGPVFTLAGKAQAVGRDFSLALGALSCVADDNR